MENFDIKSMKFLGAVVIVCLIFVICLPFINKTIIQDKSTDTAIVQTSQTIETEDDIASENVIDENNTKTDELVNEDESAKTPDGLQAKNENADENLDEQAAFLRAEMLKAENKYESAVYEYQKLIKNNDKTSVQAKCNEEIARIYAVMKRYGTALPHAQQAYKLEPNDVRELLLARIYYKTGNSTKATEHIDAILNRDFAE